MGCGLCPVLAFFDFAAAFSSVLHSWIMIIIEESRTPDGLRQIIKAMYRFVECGTVVDGVLRFLYFILSGVMQECPLSGLIFAIVVDSFQSKFVKEAENTGAAVFRACADDIGAAQHDIRALGLLKLTLDSAKEYAGLQLKPQKCVYVPTSQVLDAKLENEMQAWLETNLPDWRNFRVQPVTAYLAFLMGLEAGAQQYDGTIEKWRLRSVAIADRHSAASESSFLYNSRAVAVVGYKMQLTITPANYSARKRVC